MFVILASSITMCKKNSSPRDGWLGSRGFVATAEMIVGRSDVRIAHHFSLSHWGRRLNVCRLLRWRLLLVVFEILVIIFELLVFVSIIVVLSVEGMWHWLDFHNCYKRSIGAGAYFLDGVAFLLFCIESVQFSNLSKDELALSSRFIGRSSSSY